MNKLNLSIATGDRRISLDDHAMLEVPKSLGTRHKPIPHIEFFNAVESQLAKMGLSMVQSQHALSKDGLRYFGISQIESDYEDFSTVVGFRSSQDSTFAASLMFGNGVFVCSNLMFTGEASVKHKHTHDMIANLSSEVYAVLKNMGSIGQSQANIIDTFKSTDLTDSKADSIIIDMLRRDIIKPTDSKRTIQQWYSPEHEEFAEDKNVWRLMNAITEAYKPRTERGNMLDTLQNRSIKVNDYLMGLTI